jgi:hypothetical protein
VLFHGFSDRSRLAIGVTEALAAADRVLAVAGRPSAPAPLRIGHSSHGQRMTQTLPLERRPVLHRRGLRLEYFTRAGCPVARTRPGHARAKPWILSRPCTHDDAHR